MMRTDRDQAWRLTIVVFASLISLTAILVPGFRLRIDSPTGGTIVLTLWGMAWLFMAFLAAQRFTRSASRLDATIAVALFVFAAVDIGFALDRAAVSGDQAASAPVLPYALLAAAVLARGAMLRDRALVRRPKTVLVVLWAAVMTLPILAAQLLGLLPGVEGYVGPEPTHVVTLRALVGAFLAIGAVGLVTRHRREDDPLVDWLAPALALGALAQLHRVLIPAATSPELTWANVLQVAAAAVLVVGCVRETRSYQRRLTESAVADERRRIARDLHDGVAQDVAFIASQTKSLNAQHEDERLVLITSAAERALADSRCIVGALSRASAQPLSASIALQAQEFARRWSLEVDVAATEDVTVQPEKQEAVLRIVGEALSNAARHAHAQRVRIEVAAVGDGPLRVAVTDDGRGFWPDTAQMTAVGFGLRSMRERAHLVGGEVDFLSEPGHGTRVEIAIP
jgi:signal transduction histidine kinase